MKGSGMLYTDTLSQQKLHVFREWNRFYLIIEMYFTL